ncbi:Recombinase [Desulfosporosinus sp. I2]|uniref:recombinase family protein n=1 Tax=Desulfosporosinus sp. I2 TaxID=1617025 RepID=UPI00061EED99|nr:recombinase family protein [Desulfosporosinus sp. I2]KJR44915.1 Recombinase [Desulfosporosinus sp. I2]
MKNVRIIPAIPKENKKLRVAAYCRVSTSGPEQLRSLEIQISAYTEMIRSHPNWLYAGVFFDIESGLRRSGRTGLDKMLRKAEKGKIDYIITKSISRVSRDTLEILKMIRFLRERGINMHFENEKLDSIEVDKEFEITLRSMLAQDESRNTSENIQWGFQRKFEKGDMFTTYKNFMGYDCVVKIGVLSAKDYEDWRFGRVPYLEKVCKTNLSKLSFIIKELRAYALENHLKSSSTAYNQCGVKGKKIPLRFSKSGYTVIEEAYATHYVVNTKKEERDSELSKTPEERNH